MIATLEGDVSEKLAGQIVLVVGGIGYGIQTTTEELATLKVGAPVKLYIYEYIREQNDDLFGFSSKESLELFRKLLDVSGVGPKMALSVLSIGPVQALQTALSSGDVAYISQASGVGKRLAQRLVVELKDKVGLGGSDLSSAAWLKSDKSLSTDEAAQALLALGYSTADAAAALAKVDQTLGTEERVKLALSNM